MLIIYSSAEIGNGLKNLNLPDQDKKQTAVLKRRFVFSFDQSYGDKRREMIQEFPEDLTSFCKN